MMIQAILRFLTGDGVTSIVDRLADAYQAKLNAENDADRIKAEVEVAHLQAQLQAQVRGDATWLPKVVRACWAVLFLSYFGKVIVWDKMLGWGSTPDLSSNQWTVVFMVLGFYFLRDVTRR